MIYKIIRTDDSKTEELYFNAGSEYHKRKLSFPLGQVLTDLLQINFAEINAWIDNHFDEFDRRRFSMNTCEYFNSLTEDVQFLLLSCTKLRFLRHRIGVRHAAKHDNYFANVEKAVSFITKAVDTANDNEQYFSFFFKHHLKIYNSDGIYSSQEDLSVFNYFFPIALSYARNEANGDSTEKLYEFISDAENDRSKVAELIVAVPENTLHRNMIDRIQEHFWNPATGRYRVMASKALDDVADIFIDCEDLRLKFLEIMYEYECLQSEKLYAFGWLDTYIALCTLECYRNGYRICKCPECGKYFVRTSNSRRLCGDPVCTSQNKKKSAQQRKNEFHIDDQNIFSAVYKSLCYSKIGKSKASLNNNAYVIEGVISPELSKQIVEKLQSGLVQNYRDDSRRYKEEIRSATEGQQQMLELYNSWLKLVRKRYSHQYVIECYQKSSLSDIRSSVPFYLDYYQIVGWSQIETVQYVLIE